MQTSQVTNPANLFSTPTTNKQADNGNAGQSFGQVLSREVSERASAPEPMKVKDASPAPAKQQSAATSQPANAANSTNTNKPAKSAETKPFGDSKTIATKNKSADKTGKGEASDGSAKTEESTSQVSDELLALVANLNQMSIAGAQTSDAGRTGTDDVTSTDAAQMLAAAGLIRPDATARIDPLAEASDAGLKGKADTGADALNAVGEDGKKRPAVADLKDDLVATTTADLAAKGRELLNVSAKAEGGRDFAAQIKDSIAVAGANASTAIQPVQAAILANVTTQSTHATQATEKLTPAVGSTAWDQALGQKVVWMVAGEQQTASLTLNPPDLGPLQIVLSVNNSQANATFTAAQPEVRQALEAAMPKLRDMLGEAGIQLGQATVNSGSAQQQGAQDQHASQSRRGFSNGSGSNDHIAEPARVGRVAPSSSGQGMVDTFA